MKLETQIRVCTALQWVCVVALVLCALAGCGTAPPRVEIQRVNVAVPLECKEQAPLRPVMPTETLQPGADVDQFAQAAMAEIERREGYEVQLVAALEACTKPIGDK